MYLSDRTNGATVMKTMPNPNPLTLWMKVARKAKNTTRTIAPMLIVHHFAALSGGRRV